MSFFLVHDFPDTATFLDEEGRIRVTQRPKDDRQSSARHESFQMFYIWAAPRDRKTWCAMLIYMGTDMPLYAFSLFLPTIIKTWATIQYTLSYFRFRHMPAQQRSPSWLGFVADRTRQRGLCNICASLLGIAGFAMPLTRTGPHIQYAKTFLVALGIYPCIPNTISWVSNNTEGVYKRGIVLGLVIGWGHLNGIASSNIYFKPPRYTVDYATILAYLAVCLFGGSCLRPFFLKRENAARLAGKRDYLIRGKTETEVERLGDIRLDFLYTLQMATWWGRDQGAQQRRVAELIGQRWERFSSRGSGYDFTKQMFSAQFPILGNGRTIHRSNTVCCSKSFFQRAWGLLQKLKNVGPLTASVSPDAHSQNQRRIRSSPVFLST
ncbi:hypothetical protein BDZ45DRAFT_309740 [Acephala macrosclerotiorum]|nr:hypothetical protein BDZ45DRAFT_309740 [Acephala macrosclerotiorum]